MSYDDTNRGVLFSNDKEANPQRPDMTGRINVNGHDKRLAAWTKRNEDGSFKLLSLTVSDFVTPSKPIETVKKEKSLRDVANQAKERDVALDDLDGEPVDLSDIPF